MVPDEPESIISCVECVDRGGSLSEQQKRMLRLFAAWRAAVWRLEAEVDGSIRVLLFSAKLAEQHGDADIQVAINMHAYETFRIEMPPPPPVARWEGIVCRRGRRTDLLPEWMRTLKRPRAED